MLRKASITTPLRVPNDGSSGRSSFSSQRKCRSSTTSRGSRHSVLGSLRRSSIIQDGRKELRLQIDRQSHQKNIKHLIELLTKLNYSQQISAKHLVSPSTKDVLSIFEFLLSLLSIPYPPKKKLEDEFPRILKLLRFPYNIAKRQFQPIGSMHNWPTILYALIWMCNLIQYHDTLQKDPITLAAATTDVDGPTSSVQWLFHQNAYIFFMEGMSLEDLAAVDDAFFVKTSYQIGSQDLRHLDDQRNELEVRLEELKEKLEIGKSLQTQVTDTERDIENLEVYLKKMEIYQASVDQNKEMLQCNIEELKKERDNNDVEIQQLTTTIANQRMTVEEMHRLAAVMESLDSEVKDIEEAQKELQGEVLFTETQLLKQQKDFHNTVEEYHNNARICKLIPISASNAQGFDYALHLESDRMDEERMDLDKIKCRLRIVLHQWKEASREIRAKKMKVLAELQQLKAIHSTNSQDLVWEQGKLRRLEEVKSIREQEYATEMQRLEAELEAEEEKIALLAKGSAGVQDVRDLQKTIKELHTELQELEEYRQRRAQEVEECRFYVCKTFAELNLAVEGKLKEFEAGVIAWCKDKRTSTGIEFEALEEKMHLQELEREIDSIACEISKLREPVNPNN